MIDIRPRLLLAITAHGFGHAAQVAPVVNRLCHQSTELSLLVVTDIQRDWLTNWIDVDFEYLPMATDPGIRMRGPLDVDIDATVAAYQSFDERSNGLLRKLEQIIDERDVTMLLADVPWLPLVAARNRGIPGIALCSLNWADIIEPMLPRPTSMRALLDNIRNAYNNADLFIRPAPAMPMEWLDNRCAVGHISRIGRNERSRIVETLGIHEQQRIAVLQFGGETGSTGINLPRHDELTWLVAGRADISRDLVSANTLIDHLGLRFIDLVASVDLMLTKPGYSSFAEAATHGLPLLSVHRDNWPETPWLLDWVREQVPLREITRYQLISGGFYSDIEQLLASPKSLGLNPNGIEETIGLLSRFL